MKFLPLAFLLLAGCASVADLQMSSVDREDISQKPIEEVSRCLAYQMAEAPITDENGNTMFIMKNGYQAPIATVTLIPFEGGTKIQVRQANGMVQTGGWRKCL
jgi:outer membrane biogenesis lipoprotein LolB|tara:strand:+ start:1228 stop:1536 length:309 start_codon:yes stop_codon:yes gene_type:complete